MNRETYDHAVELMSERMELEKLVELIKDVYRCDLKHPVVKVECFEISAYTQITLSSKDARKFFLSFNEYLLGRIKQIDNEFKSL